MKTLAILAFVVLVGAEALPSPLGLDSGGKSFGAGGGVGVGLTKDGVALSKTETTQSGSSTHSGSESHDGSDGNTSDHSESHDKTESNSSSQTDTFTLGKGGLDMDKSTTNTKNKTETDEVHDHQHTETHDEGDTEDGSYTKDSETDEESGSSSQKNESETEKKNRHSHLGLGGMQQSQDESKHSEKSEANSSYDRKKAHSTETIQNGDTTTTNEANSASNQQASSASQETEDSRSRSGDHDEGSSNYSEEVNDLSDEGQSRRKRNVPNENIAYRNGGQQISGHESFHSNGEYHEGAEHYVGQEQLYQNGGAQHWQNGQYAINEGTNGAINEQYLRNGAINGQNGQANGQFVRNEGVNSENAAINEQYLRNGAINGQNGQANGQFVRNQGVNGQNEAWSSQHGVRQANGQYINGQVENLEHGAWNAQNEWNNHGVRQGGNVQYVAEGQKVGNVQYRHQEGWNGQEEELINNAVAGRQYASNGQEHVEVIKNGGSGRQYVAGNGQHANGQENWHYESGNGQAVNGQYGGNWNRQGAEVIQNGAHTHYVAGQQVARNGQYNSGNVHYVSGNYGHGNYGSGAHYIENENYRSGNNYGHGTYAYASAGYTGSQKPSVRYTKVTQGSDILSYLARNGHPLNNENTGSNAVATSSSQSSSQGSNVNVIKKKGAAGDYLKTLLGGTDLKDLLKNQGTGNGRFVLVPGKNGNEHRYYDTVSGRYLDIRHIQNNGQPVVIPVGGNSSYKNGYNIGYGVIYYGNGVYKYGNQVYTSKNIAEFMKTQGFNIPLTAEGFPVYNGYYIAKDLYYTDEGNYIYQDKIITKDKIAELCKTLGYDVQFTNDGLPVGYTNNSYNGNGYNNGYYVAKDLYYTHDGNYRYKNETIPKNKIADFCKTNNLDVQFTDDYLPIGYPNNGYNNGYYVAKDLYYTHDGYYIFQDKTIPKDKIADFCKTNNIDAQFTDDYLPVGYPNNGYNGNGYNNGYYVAKDLYYTHDGYYIFQDKTIPKDKIADFCKTNNVDAKFTDDGLPVGYPNGNGSKPKGTDDQNYIDLGHGIIFLVDEKIYKYNDQYLSTDEIVGFCKTLGYDIPFTDDGYPAGYPYGSNKNGYYVSKDLYYTHDGNYSYKNQTISKDKIADFCKTNKLDGKFTDDGLPIGYPNGGDNGYYVSKDLYYTHDGNYRYKGDTIPKDKIADFCKTNKLDGKFTDDGLPIGYPGNGSKPKGTGDNNTIDLGHGIIFLVDEGKYKFNDQYLGTDEIIGFCKTQGYDIPFTDDGYPAGYPDIHHGKTSEYQDLGHGIIYTGDGYYTYLDHVIPSAYMPGLLKILGIDIDLPDSPNAAKKGSKATGKAKDLGHGFTEVGDGTYKYKERTIEGDYFEECLQYLGFGYSDDSITGDGKGVDDYTELIDEFLATKKTTDDTTKTVKKTTDSATSTVTATTSKTGKSKDLGHGFTEVGDGTYKYKGRTIEGDYFEECLQYLGFIYSDDTITGDGKGVDDYSELIDEFLATKKATDDTTKTAKKTTDSATSTVTATTSKTGKDSSSKTKDLGHGFTEVGDGTYKYKERTIEGDYFEECLQYLGFGYSDDSITGDGKGVDDYTELIDEFLATKKTTDDTTKTAKKTTDSATSTVTATTSKTGKNAGKSKDLGHGFTEVGDGTYKYKERTIEGDYFEECLQYLGFIFSDDTITGDGKGVDDYTELIDEFLATKKTTDDTTKTAKKTTDSATSTAAATTSKTGKDSSSKTKDLGHGFTEVGDGTYKYKERNIEGDYFQECLQYLGFGYSDDTITGDGKGVDDYTELIDKFLATKKTTDDTTKTAKKTTDSATSTAATTASKTGKSKDLGHGFTEVGDGTYIYKDTTTIEGDYFQECLQYLGFSYSDDTITGDGKGEDDYSQLIEEFLATKKTTDRTKSTATSATNSVTTGSDSNGNSSSSGSSASGSSSSGSDGSSDSSASSSASGSDGSSNTGASDSSTTIVKKSLKSSDSSQQSSSSSDQETSDGNSTTSEQQSQQSSSQQQDKSASSSIQKADANGSSSESKNASESKQQSQDSQQSSTSTVNGDGSSSQSQSSSSNQEQNQQSASNQTSSKTDADGNTVQSSSSETSSESSSSSESSYEESSSS
ncbi:uncharacterized protein LOC142985369 [Anticarsia gemmatalis]|uniref:uncharacterized protein LOC142985369 n=1 Tax=Anticarsia gemmatalis TaxID=129554 RepID=UPI003F770555